MKQEINQFDASGEKHGLWKARYISGLLYYEANYINGKKHGQYKDWYENGQHKDWYENGQPHMEGHYVNGEKHGLWKWWDNSGELIYEQIFIF